MLMGEFERSIDAKGRLIIPAKFREQLGSTFVLTRGMDGCLFGYPMNEWEQLQAKVATLPLAKKDARTFTRFLFSAAAECEIDKQGRINIPKPLMTHAALDKDCVLVGVNTRFEVWDVERWATYTAAAEADVDEISENLTDFGL